MHPHQEREAPWVAQEVADPLAASDLLVQGGAAERSFLRTVDLQFNQADGPTGTPLADLIAANRVRLDPASLPGDAGQVLADFDPSNTLAPFRVVDHAIELNFGPLGLGGVDRGSRSIDQYWNDLTAGDGYYGLDADLAGDGKFATREFFDRLLGEVNGDHAVDQDDVALTMLNLGQPGGDVDGDGTTSDVDVSLATRSKGRALAAGLPLNG